MTYQTRPVHRLVRTGTTPDNIPIMRELPTMDHESMVDFAGFYEDGVTFADLQAYFGDTGAMELGNRDKNIVYWTNVSKSFGAMLLELLTEKRLYLRHCKEYVYILTGHVVPLPIARKTGHAYRTPHWSPVVIAHHKVMRTETLAFRRSFLEAYGCAYGYTEEEMLHDKRKNRNG